MTHPHQPDAGRSGEALGAGYRLLDRIGSGAVGAVWRVNSRRAEFVKVGEAGGQAGSYSADQVVRLGEVVRAARTFLESGEVATDLAWRLA